MEKCHDSSSYIHWLYFANNIVYNFREMENFCTPKLNIYSHFMFQCFLNKLIYVCVCKYVALSDGSGFVCV